MVTQVEQALKKELMEFKKWIYQNDSGDKLKSAVIGGYEVMFFKNPLAIFFNKINSRLKPSNFESITTDSAMGYHIPTSYFLEDIEKIASFNSKDDLDLWVDTWYAIIDNLLSYHSKEVRGLTKYDPHFHYQNIHETLLNKWFSKVNTIALYLNVYKNSKPWHFPSQFTLELNKCLNTSLFREPSPEDEKYVTNFYKINPINNYEIKSIRVIYNQNLMRGFSSHLEKCQGYYNKPSFVSSDAPIPEEIVTEIRKKHRGEAHESLERKKWREQTRHLWTVFKKSQEHYTDPQYPNVTVLTLWHGLKEDKAIENIAEIGFAHVIEKNVDGYFGAGYYFTPQIGYAQKYATKSGQTFFKALLCRVAAFSLFPAIVEDGGPRGSRLYGKGTLRGFNGAFAPVVHVPGGNKLYYNSPHIGNPPEFIEIAILDSAPCLPQFEVTFGPT